ncbi:MAG TPA: penicillin-binding protein 2 [Candidatus Paceibacterota bacterium]|nr:penicillin-binding protein 2 [Candidatus Paceibacterota bacterium]HOL53793.1 penicillin-binding protein 2 [Candidatus Paceibacterota bacterium]HPP16934.1 penicillin-binding protein 2 [Candidatus Paceibacterota bacterium]HRU33430.1 penicillin-binding protein 2 [Candidatus Paceibacterota bacterium]
MRRKKTKQFLNNWRLYFILIIFVLSAGIMLWRLYSLQILRYEDFSQKAAAQVKTTEQIKNNLQYLRGTIYFQTRDGTLIPVAVNKKFFEIYAVPKEIGDVVETAEILSKQFDLSYEDLVIKFSKKQSLYELVMKKVNEASAQKVNDLHLKGIYTKEYIGRYYPYQEFASQVIGYAKDDVKDFHGQYGLEKYYDDYLSNQSQSKNLFDFLSLKNLTYSRSNSDIITTIDFNIQKKAEDLLQKNVKEWKAEGGTIIVMEPKTGKVLALANYPNFDPNHYSSYSLTSFLNPATQLTYEPGSVFKIITVAAGLDSHRITPQTQFYDNGEVIVNGKKIQNWDLKAHGACNVFDIIAYSLNTGAVYLEKLIGHDIFHQYVLDFGFNQKTGIDLPNEAVGNINNLKSFNDIYFATASFGQGISVTPIAMINAFAAIANNGLMMTPYVAESIIDSEGNQKKIIEPKPKEQVISAEVANQLRIIMVNSVEKNKVAEIKGYQIAGKTGTAQIPDAKGTYSNKTIQSFIGYAPAEDPRFIVLVKLDKPEAPLAGSTVVPMFRDLTKFILDYYEIPPRF